MDVDRYIKLGISELDDILPLIPRGYSFLLYGPSGVGKTIFSLQFICDGIKKFDERGVYFVLKEFPNDLRFKALSLGFDVTKMEKENMLIIVDCFSKSIPIRSSEKFVSDGTVHGVLRALKKIIENIGNVDRVVIDPVSVIFEEEKVEKISKLLAVFSQLKITSLLVSSEEHAKTLEHLCPGVFEMTLKNRNGKTEYSLVIKKIEGIRQQTPIYFPYRIVRGRGIHILKASENT